MSDMIERVGTALAKACMEQFGSTWSNDVKLRFARAGIEAMREPTEAMMVAGGLTFEEIAFGPDTDGSGIIFTDMGRVFTSMISAALSQDTHSPSPLNPPADEDGAAASSQEQKP